jgi:hypothetical protein
VAIKKKRREQARSFTVDLLIWKARILPDIVAPRPPF